MSAPSSKRDHGGGLDAAAAEFGGELDAWLDLSTGINPIAYPVRELSPEVWGRLPDTGAMTRLLDAARAFWAVPDGVEIIAAAGASPLIARMPDLGAGDEVYIPTPTYNEHAAAFSARNWHVGEDPAVPVHVYVHPNNPDGRQWPGATIGTRGLTIVDESFCDTVPEQSHIARAADPGVIVLKSFGKFWGLAGLRLGFAMALPETFAPAGQPNLQELMGPWSVSGPALEVGTRALQDHAWADATRVRLRRDAARLDGLMQAAGAEVVGGTTLFRTYRMNEGAEAWQRRLAKHHIWTRIFPYSTNWIRLGLPGTPDDWVRLEAAL